MSEIMQHMKIFKLSRDTGKIDKEPTANGLVLHELSRTYIEPSWAFEMIQRGAIMPVLSGYFGIRGQLIREFTTNE